MIRRVYTVYDIKIEAYLQPFFALSKGDAIRDFVQVVNDKSTKIGLHPEDFTLFEIGTYDDSTAKLVAHTTPTALGVAIEFIREAA